MTEKKRHRIRILRPGETLTFRLRRKEEFQVPAEAQRVLDAVRERELREGERILGKLKRA